MPKNNNRPVFLNLARISLPVTALISIAHRIAGIILFLSIPFVIYMLDLSLGSQLGYNRVRHLLGLVQVKLAVIVILWALAHHFFAGVRVLLIDCGIGVERDEARRTAWVIVLASIVSLLIAAGVLLW